MVLFCATIPSAPRTWSCHCGEIKAKLSGEPVLSFNCHCHSCVHAARHIAKATERDGHASKIPMLHPECGGAAVSPYKAAQVEFLTPLSDDKGVSKLKFFRLGEGKAWRSYTTCCGTQMTNCILPGLMVFNRNGIRNDEDGSPFEPAGVINSQKSNAFEPDKVPEPSHDTAPTIWIPKFMIPALTSSKLKKDYPELFPNDETVETIPIAW